MKNKYMGVLSGVVAVSVIAAAAISLTGGCKSQPVKEEPIVPAPVSVQPAVAPTPVAQPAANVAPAPAIPKAEPIKYTVQKGDSFSKIAKNHGVSMQELAKYNNMSLEKPLQIGVTLKIPPKAAK